MRLQRNVCPAVLACKQAVFQILLTGFWYCPGGQLCEGSQGVEACVLPRR